MSQVWHRLGCGGSDLLLALALADFSNDDGTKIYPSVPVLAAKTRQSSRTVQRQLARFRELGWLEVIRGLKGGHGTVTHYRINPRWIKGDSLSSFPDRKGDTGGSQVRHRKRSGVTPVTLRGDTAMAYNPSGSVINHQDPREVVRELGAENVLGSDYAKRFKRNAS
jgi:hypothetical protein